jgi:hypothetical protein
VTVAIGRAAASIARFSKQGRFPGPREPHEDGGAALRRDRARAQGQHAPLVKQRGEDRSEQEQPHALGRGVGGAIDDDLRATASEVARDAVDLQQQLARRDLEPDPAADGARQLRRDPTGHDLDVGLARRFRQLRQGQARGDRQAEGAVEKRSRHLAGGKVGHSRTPALGSSSAAALSRSRPASPARVSVRGHQPADPGPSDVVIDTPR